MEAFIALGATVVAADVVIAAGAMLLRDLSRAGREPRPSRTHPAEVEAVLIDGGEDDLRAIRGIGPRLAEFLHERGVHTYRRIASWSPDDVEAISRELPGFRDRIGREDWIGQARALLRAQADALRPAAPIEIPLALLAPRRDRRQAVPALDARGRRQARALS